MADIEKSIEEQIADMEREAAEAEARANRAEPSEAVQKLAAAQRRKRDAEEREAAHKRTARETAMGTKEAALRKTLPEGTLISAVDLYKMFPLGAEPEHMPACGFVVLKNPDPAACAKKDAAAQMGDKTVHEIGVDFVSACVVFPTLGDDGVRLGQFLRAHPEATGELVKEVRDLGGAKSRTRPLGRA